MHLIPQAKVFEKKEGFLQNLTISLPLAADPRLVKALKKLPVAENGTAVDICITGTEGESYTLDIAPDRITICAPGTAGAFYAIQTLRQIFAQGDVPCLHIEDAPSLAYRGFYHDVTRGKVPTLDTLKQLVDRMAYVKLNSLQLYVEHVFPFRETADLVEKTGCITPEELVAVQDGVRPLAAEAMIRRAVEEAATYGTAIPVVEAVDSYRVVEGEESKIIDRRPLRIVQTPQVFDRELLIGALKKARRTNAVITDDCSAVERIGMSVKIVEGDERNIKVTTPMDLKIAEMLLEEMQ